jgi:hypothetical protein
MDVRCKEKKQWRLVQITAFRTDGTREEMIKPDEVPVFLTPQRGDVMDKSLTEICNLASIPG